MFGVVGYVNSFKELPQSILLILMVIVPSAIISKNWLVFKRTYEKIEAVEE